MGKRGKTLRQVSVWLNLSIVGIQFPVAILIGFFWGKWLDGMLGSWPWLTLLFSLLGITAGFVNLFRMTAQASRTEEDRLRTDTDLKVHPPEEEDEDGEGAEGPHGHPSP